MTNDVIIKFLEPDHLSKQAVKIDFKQRGSKIGLFVRMNDYDELKSKNFWRIVLEQHIPKWKESNDIDIAKIFNGAEFTKLSVPKKQTT